ncbi:hypothetical protein I204_06995 [Kwoniella mangroviensis CBS 8886]|uniref:uncharacterized protein n=1 Tax=Kwoniella mangroviensis CBS 8507 TaxID=1296122 RepID=UPI00080CFCC3|nr:uncharacterized protein I203_01033 [Kwoniella mangroviensis CBS 8507]OCF69179.1 hypothetical protein I203_01033 [Kwoniella mangroviensis CBS 8507]OCF72613.1 hypothetical protein I204_06995 [Kwoniella mangroviensis CBS 8886]
MFGMLVYVPATIGLTARRKQTKWDRAWGEVVYLGYQAGLYLANSIVAGVVGGPSYCSERLYESGRTSGVRKYPYEPIGSIRIICNAILNPYERRDTEGNITPFVQTQQEGEEQEPERDIGPYIPPPPYQCSYNDGGQGSSPTDPTDGDAYRGVSPTISTFHDYSHSPPEGDDVQLTSPSTSNYQNSNNDSSDSPLSPTMIEIVNHKMTRHQQNLPQNHNQSETRTSLRRVMDEKEDSKEVVRRALGG